MGITKKFLYEAVALTILLAILGSGLAIYHQVKRSHAIIENGITQEEINVKEVYVTQYDGKTLPGASARLLFYSIADRDPSGLANSLYLKKKGSSDYTRFTDATRLNVEDVYKVEVVRNGSGRLSRVNFSQQ